jgi:hypothetical protein
MSLGPLEYLVVAFPGNRFNGQIAPALREVVEKGIIRIIDLVFVYKAEDGTVTAVELGDLSDETSLLFDPVAEEISGLLSPEDIQQVAADLEPDTSAGLMLFEHVWAIKVRNAVVESGGKLVAQERIPLAAVERALRERAAS